MASGWRVRAKMIEHTFDDQTGVLMIALHGMVKGREFSKLTCALFRARPDMFEYYCIVDLSDYQGDISYSDMNPLQEMFSERPQPGGVVRPAWIVTPDANFHFWATALDAQLPGRIHHVVPRLDDAFAGIADQRMSDTRDGRTVL